MRATALPLLMMQLAALAGGCDDGGAAARAAVVKQYAVNLDANYKDVITKLRALQVAVDAFVAAPSAAGFDAARQAWLDARPAWGECEYSRFYGGPIDDAQGRMNEWPIDETFIDYTFVNPTGGIINDRVSYPQITAQVLATADQKGGVENLSTGFHALEFLLWGQRTDLTQGPGTRPFTDYVDGGTAANQDRRRQYLQIATVMLVADMQGLEATWDLTNPTSYGATFVGAPPNTGLQRILRGLSNMTVAELQFERLSDPFITQDRKDEESCFSESTQVDLNANALGIEDVYLGRYGALAGPSISDLVKAKNPALDAAMRTQLTAMRTAIAAIPPPFDHAVIAPAGSEPRANVQAAIDSFGPLVDSMRQVAALLGVMLNL
jgi:putative iron-regulated protein